MTALAWSRDGRFLATASRDGTSRLIAVPGGEKARVTHEDAVLAVSWSRDGRFILTASADGIARKTEIGDRDVTKLNYGGAVRRVEWSSDGRFLAAESAIIDASSAKKNLIELKGKALGWNSRGDVFAISSSESVQIFDASGEEKYRIPHEHGATSIAWSKDGRLLAIGSGQIRGRGAVRIFNTADRSEISSFSFDKMVWQVALSIDDGRLAVRSLGGTVSVIDVATKQRLFDVSGNRQINDMAWNPANGLLAIGSGGFTGPGLTQLIEPTTGDEIARLTHARAVKSLAWSPKGNFLAVGSGHFEEPGAVEIFETSTRREVASQPHRREVVALAWSPDGKLIATGANDWTARIIDVTRDQQIAVLEHEGPVRAVAWRPSGDTLATGSDDELVRIWSVFESDQSLVDAAKERASRCLTQFERQRYFLPKAPPTWCAEHRLWPYHGNDWQMWLPLQKSWLASGRLDEPPPLPRAR